MTTIQQNLLNPNNQPLMIGNFSIRQDEDGRYCLNDLHKASGGLAKHKPSNFIRNQQTQELIVEIEQVSDMRSTDFDRCSNMSIGQKAINTIKGGVKQGMYVVEDLVYSYAMWISAKFHLMVIRAYRSQVMEWMIGGKQSISPEQCGILYNIVHTRAGGNQGVIRQMWSRLKNHFKYSASYRELRAIHFGDAKHYLEVMDLKGKAETKDPGLKALPFPQEVIQVAQQISHEYKSTQYDSWYVSARDGVLSARPLPQGFYPTMDLGEFAKRFDSVLDLLYGTDTLRVGRHYLSQRKSK
ncbi:KilA-N domain-containing protein [Acinetobacter chinensis]|uniref:KilA-N domain-containing protein n=1 Tax=Acinetobacter chinensis TaxID=2004650 RepID=A0ABU3WES8_9GAMM|nr:KilA-N domain-containing protein [Acinetobacter chinensis]MDV2468903.1 KilA-N domain-containing protein [Acinetobacter chinensis]